MPGMSGDEVVAAMKEIDGLAGIPVLMLTGEPMAPDEISRLGVSGAVLKPFDVSVLVETIRATLK
jgi:DNA-binding response OmpR family regulator